VEEQVALCDMVRGGDVPALAAEAASRGAAIWTELVQCERDPAYLNRGTLLHWAVWHRQFAVVSMAVAAGADLSTVGVGCWMQDKTVQQYASFLDERAGHPYYEHAKSLEEALRMDRGLAAMKTAVQATKKSRLDMQPFTADAQLVSPETHTRLYDLVEHSCVAGLELALQRFGTDIGSTLVGPVENTYNNLGTMAHWAVWHQNWPVLRWLCAHGCMPDRQLKGVGGGWLNGKTVEGYADFMDQMCKHPFYSHRVETAACLAAISRQPAPQPATVALDCPGGHGLAAFTTTHGRYNCDICDESQATGTGMKGCRICDHDVCLTCAAGVVSVEEGLPPASAGDVAHDSASRCCVCLDARVDHLVAPCNHLCACGTCAATLMAMGAQCPICRGAMTGVERVFMA
jgi:hypothetical protein